MSVIVRVPVRDGISRSVPPAPPPPPGRFPPTASPPPAPLTKPRGPGRTLTSPIHRLAAMLLPQAPRRVQRGRALHLPARPRRRHRRPSLGPSPGAPVPRSLPRSLPPSPGPAPPPPPRPWRAERAAPPPPQRPLAAGGAAVAGRSRRDRTGV